MLFLADFIHQNTTIYFSLCVSSSFLTAYHQIDMSDAAALSKKKTAVPKKSSAAPGSMFAFIGSDLDVTLMDAREVTGKFCAFDKHMNLVLDGAKETRRLGGKPVQRDLGCVLLRGDHVVTVRSVSTKLTLPDGTAPSAAAKASTVTRTVTKAA